MDNVNALLSFVYTLLANSMASALEAVGLDHMWDLCIQIDLADVRWRLT